MASIQDTKTDPANEHPLEHMVRQLETEIQGRTMTCSHMILGLVTHVIQGHTIHVMTHDRTMIPVTVNPDGMIDQPKMMDMDILSRIMMNDHHIRYAQTERKG